MENIRNSDKLLSVDARLDLITQLQTAKGSKLSPEEEMLLRVAENECVSEIDVNNLTQEQVNKFFENALYLRNDLHIGLLSRTSRDIINNGPLNIIYRLPEGKRPVILQDAAKYIFKKAVGEDLIIVPESGDGFIMGSRGNFVDLASLTVVRNGERATSLENLLRDPDTSRLFGDLSSAKDLKVSGSTATFIHPTYGEVFVTEVPAKEGENFILRIKRISDGGVYIPLSAAKDINMSACFGDDDFTVWGYSDGSLKICDKNDPNKTLYESEGGESGRLDRVPQSSPEEFIEFYDYGTVPKVDLISEYEPRTNTYFFATDRGPAHASNFRDTKMPMVTRLA
jgi:hypothetical protein